MVRCALVEVLQQNGVMIAQRETIVSKNAMTSSRNLTKGSL
jgi:hypothetical protein